MKTLQQRYAVLDDNDRIINFIVAEPEHVARMTNRCVPVGAEGIKGPKLGDMLYQDRWLPDVKTPMHDVVDHLLDQHHAMLNAYPSRSEQITIPEGLPLPTQTPAAPSKGFPLRRAIDVLCAFLASAIAVHAGMPPVEVVALVTASVCLVDASQR